MSKTWTNITTQIFDLSKCIPFLTQELGFMDMVMHPDLNLEETMHAHEINDPKIDPKFDINSSFTIRKMVEGGLVRPAKALSIKETKDVYA